MADKNAFELVTLEGPTINIDVDLLVDQIIKDPLFMLLVEEIASKGELTKETLDPMRSLLINLIKKEL